MRRLGWMCRSWSTTRQCYNLFSLDREDDIPYLPFAVTGGRADNFNYTIRTRIEDYRSRALARESYAASAAVDEAPYGFSRRLSGVHFK